MTATSGLFIFLVLTCMLALSFVGNEKSFRVHADDDVEPLKAADSVSKLPEPFSDEKLPVKLNNTNLCFAHIGCIRKIRSMYAPLEPMEIDASFYLVSKKGFMNVRYNVTRNCLNGDQDCDFYPFDLSLLEKSNFDPRNRTIILIGGWNSLEPNLFLEDVRSQWLTMTESVNVIEAYWTGASRSNYWSAVSSTKVFAKQLTVLIYYLAQMKGGYDLSDPKYTGKFNFVGHSLGAHISSFVGKNLGGLVGLITALDPALPSFQDVEPDFMLHRTDAKLVQVLHTNGGLYGQVNPIGDLDFYANDGNHQPDCNLDPLSVCSHNRAVTLYIQFIQNEIYLKHFLSTLDKKYHINHRLFSYHSNSFEQFQNGSTFIDSCYSVADPQVGTQTGIEHCIVPVDFVTDADRQLHLLKTRYNIDITAEKQHKSRLKLYFFTAKKSPYLNNHHLLKMKARKSSSLPDRCDVIIDLQMSKGASSQVVVKNYKFRDLDEYVELTIPLLSMNMKSKYELAGLDSQQFYESNFTLLKESLMYIFPKAIKVKGYLDNSSSNRQSWSASLIKLFGFSKDEDPVSDCSIYVTSMSVQPMKKLSRLLIANYDTHATLKTSPDLTFLPDKYTVWESALEDVGKRVQRPGNEFYLDNALIGTYDDDTPEQDSVQDQPPEVTEGSVQQTDIDERPETSSVSKTAWLLLTMITIALIVGFVYWHTTNRTPSGDQVLLTESEQ